MNKRKVNMVAVGFIVLVPLVIGLLLTNSLRRSAHIVLPERTGAVVEGDPTGDGQGELEVVAVTPATVQTAIATLTRPNSYCRSVSVERFWSDGSGATAMETTVSGGWTRTDATLPGGQVRHALTDGETTYLWYGEEERFFTGAAGDISPDDEQSIPTYENILRQNPDRIAAADYRQLSDVNCIFVETKPDEGGVVLRYWVSVDTGLLVSAERLEGETLVYRMTALTLSDQTPTTVAFTLPDGTVMQQIP